MSNKAIWGGAVIAFFTLFCTAWGQTDSQWKTPLMVFFGFGCAVCAIGWLCCHRREFKTEPARGDLLLTIRHFDYDEMDNQLCATLAFYNNDSMPRNVLAVRFLYRPTAHAKGFQMYDTGPRDTLWEGHFDPVKLQPGTEETKRYRSVPPPKISPEIIDRPGSQFGLHISFTNAKRQTDHAVVIAMEVPTLPVVFSPATTPTPLVVQVRASSASRTLVSRSWPIIENLSLDSIRDSKQIDALREKFAPRPLTKTERFRKLRDRLFDW